jgi:hypothetical protein
MTRKGTSKRGYILAQKYVSKHPKEFSIGPSESLFCNLCGTVLDCSRKSNVDSHRRTKKHMNNMIVSDSDQIVTKQHFLMT